MHDDRAPVFAMIHSRLENRFPFGSIGYGHLDTESLPCVSSYFSPLASLSRRPWPATRPRSHPVGMGWPEHLPWGGEGTPHAHLSCSHFCISLSCKKRDPQIHRACMSRARVPGVRVVPRASSPRERLFQARATTLHAPSMRADPISLSPPSPRLHRTHQVGTPSATASPRT